MALGAVRRLPGPERRSIMSWENWAVAIGLGALLMMFFVLMELFFASGRHPLDHSHRK
jgi:hypothetical protein